MNDIDKFNLISNTIENKFLYTRHKDLKQLNKKLLGIYGIQAIHGTADSLDFNLIAGINKDWGYVDIYFIMDNQDNLYITEINISKE